MSVLLIQSHTESSGHPCRPSVGETVSSFSRIHQGKNRSVEKRREEKRGGETERVDPRRGKNKCMFNHHVHMGQHCDSVLIKIHTDQQKVCGVVRTHKRPVTLCLYVSLSEASRRLQIRHEHNGDSE